MSRFNVCYERAGNRWVQFKQLLGPKQLISGIQFFHFGLVDTGSTQFKLAKLEDWRSTSSSELHHACRQRFMMCLPLFFSLLSLSLSLQSLVCLCLSGPVRSAPLRPALVYLSASEANRRHPSIMFAHVFVAFACFCIVRLCAWLALKASKRKAS